MFIDDAFSTGTGLEHAGLLGWSTDSVRWNPLQNPMPKSVLSEGREDQLLRE